ncbi:hypothetical protein SDC9_149329 [bioreactor metagenome]|uniref:Uncharacterized protein n=1 Tax=bioreactor metagenome TaxID=1076179 RepID=A0A645EKX2_9ZZZZ
MRIIGVAVFMIFDTLLYILIIQVELIDVVIRAVLFIVILNDSFQCRFLLIRILLVVLFFLF